jgi:hypothetical protein
LGFLVQLVTLFSATQNYIVLVHMRSATADSRKQKQKKNDKHKRDSSSRR